MKIHTLTVHKQPLVFMKGALHPKKRFASSYSRLWKAFCELPSASRTFPLFTRYGLTTLLVIAAFLLRSIVFDDVAGYPFLLFYPVIVITGSLFDRGNGVYATLLSAFLISFFELPFKGSALGTFRYDVVAVFLFVATGLIAAFMVETLHKVLLALNDAHKKLRQYAQMQTLLLSEISHRIRNDLSIVTSTLALQSITTESEPARKALESAAERLQVLTRVQSRLSLQSLETETVDSQAYIQDLCSDLQTTLLPKKQISLNVEAESHKIEQRYAVAIGLIVNELITNAVKYAFSQEKGGTISVAFKRAGDSYDLQVADNGIGMEHEHTARGSGLGLNLVRSLASQLGGNFSVQPSLRGTLAQVAFPAEA